MTPDDVRAQREEVERATCNAAVRADWIYQEVGEAGRTSQDSDTAAKWNTRLALLDAARVIRRLAATRPISDELLSLCIVALTGAATMLDTIKLEWAPENCWSDYDQNVRNRVSAALRALYELEQSPMPFSAWQTGERVK